MATIFGYFYLNFISTLSQNVVPISAEEKSIITFFFPQGWGFFTKNPRDAKYRLYKLAEAKKPQLVNFKITAPQNLFGFSRKGNRICIDLIRLRTLLPKPSEWVESNLDEDEFIFPKNELDTIQLDPDDILYIQPGKYLIKEYLITPWNWLQYPESNTGENKYYAFELK